MVEPLKTGLFVEVQIRVPPLVPIQPKTFRFPQRPLDFKNPEQRSVKLSWFDSCYDHVMPTEAKT